MSKRDEDSQTDIEVGMTTAERRRRRRRGGGLRVPSDNVPRRNSVPPVATPVPEDPALAMSIAYSFSNEGSEAVPRASARELHEAHDTTQIAPIPADTVPDGAAAISAAASAAGNANVDATPDGIAEILHTEALESDRARRAAEDDDGVPITGPFVPVSTGVPEVGDSNDDFETKTREMSAVDLESLGLSESLTGGGAVPSTATHATPPAPPAAALAHRSLPAAGRVPSREIATPPPTPTVDPLAMPRALAREIAPAPATGTSGAFSVREPDAAPSAPAAAAGESSISIDPSLYGGDIAIPRRPSDVDIEVEGFGEASAATGDPAEAAASPSAAEPVVSRVDTPPPPPLHAQAAAVGLPSEPAASAPEVAARSAKPRLGTVALSEDDLEEVRAQTGKPVVDADAAAAAAAAAAASEPTVVVALEAMEHALDEPPVERVAVATMPPPTTRRTEPLSIPDIDFDSINEPIAEPVNERAEHSGEIVVDVDDAVEVRAQTGPTAPTAPPRTAPPTPPPEPRRSSSSIPPASAAQTGPTAHTAGTSGAIAVPVASPSSAAVTPPPIFAAATGVAHPSPPPPPPAVAKAPPAPPPPAKKPDKAPRTTGELPKMSRGKPWFVDLFDEDYLRTLPFLTPQATQAEAAFVLDAMGLASGAQVLDVGCGYGRHAMELAARGIHVVGLDLSTPLLVRGGEEAHRRGLTINFIRGDMRELDFDGQFDGAYCLFSTFGYFDDETNKKTAANIARALKPGGKVLIEILNRDYVIADLPTRVWWEGDGCVVLEEVELNYFSSRIQVNRSVVFDDGRQLEQEISVRAYSLHEVGKLMHSAGFRVLEVSGGYQTRGRFFGNQSRHIIVLAERTSGR